MLFTLQREIGLPKSIGHHFSFASERVMATQVNGLLLLFCFHERHGYPSQWVAAFQLCQQETRLHKSMGCRFLTVSIIDMATHVNGSLLFFCVQDRHGYPRQWVTAFPLRPQMTRLPKSIVRHFSSPSTRDTATQVNGLLLFFLRPRKKRQRNSMDRCFSTASMRNLATQVNGSLHFFYIHERHGYLNQWVTTFILHLRETQLPKSMGRCLSYASTEDSNPFQWVAAFQLRPQETWLTKSMGHRFSSASMKDKATQVNGSPLFICLQHINGLSSIKL